MKQKIKWNRKYYQQNVRFGRVKDKFYIPIHFEGISQI